MVMIDCGDKVKLTPDSNKIEVIKMSYKKEPKATKEYNEIAATLRKEADKVNKAAFEELNK